MKIIDTHVHLDNIFDLKTDFPLEERTPATADPCKPNFYEFLAFRNIYLGKLNYLYKPLIARAARRISKYGNIPNLLESMEKNGIDRSILLPVDPNVITESIFEACRKNPKLIPFCSIHPHDKEKSSKLKRYIKAGCRGLKLHPVIQEVLPNDPATFDLIEEARGLKIPVLFHVGWGSIGKGNYGFAHNYRELLSSFPDIIFIFAHMGFYEPFPVLDLIEKHDNVYCDTSWQPAGIILKAIKKLGENRIILGTDWPFCLQGTSLKIVLKITEGKPKLREKILHKNAENIIQL